jgi:crotonobetainyl-CoA:carnitine CoA-transferase CaiB-like acyl-CoA transferase
MTPSSPGTTGQRGPLSGIRVLDVSTVYAAPITAMLLGDYGADVIKSSTQGGPGSHPRAVVEGDLAEQADGDAGDFGKPEGQELLRQLAAEADVLVEDFRPGVMERWCLGPIVSWRSTRGW